MSMKSDNERLQKQNLRRRHREEGESNLRKNLSEPHGDDLSATVTANRVRATQQEKIDRLKRHR
tara:strand:+ start:200 stop:391 length:192 start_codon:yes stop_codon:yes gene_type:complete